MEVMEWLLDSDPAIRWQVMRDLTDASAEDEAKERARVVSEGWGKQLLDLQEPGGTWDGGTYRPGWVDDSKPFFDAWTATHYGLQLLCLLGPDPVDPKIDRAVSLVGDHVTWDVNDAPYFDGETEPCVNGIALTVGAYFGRSIDTMIDRLLSDRLDDGGWNCWAEYGASVSSFHTTICVVEGLLAWEQAGGESPEVSAARASGEEYLLDRRLFRSLSTDRLVDPRFTMFSFPYYWYHDILRGLDHFRNAGAAFDERCREATDLLIEKRENGRWPLENVHQGPTPLRMEGPEGASSRWNTLRGMRVLDWAGRG